MIFGTVGTHTQGFNRLVMALDECASRTDEPVVIQIGASGTEPRHAQWFRFDSPERIESLTREARVVVMHGGAGSLLAALEAGRDIVALPRLRALGEAVDDHQLELCEALAHSGFVRVVTDVSRLDVALTSGPPRAEPSLALRARLTSAVASAVADLSAYRLRSESGS